jgi:hypothetical protein
MEREGEVMSGPSSPPWTDIGRLQSEIELVKAQLHAKAEYYQMDSIRHSMDCLECTMREIRSEIAGLCHRLQTLEEDKVKS